MVIFGSAPYIYFYSLFCDHINTNMFLKRTIGSERTAPSRSHNFNLDVIVQIFPCSGFSALDAFIIISCTFTSIVLANFTGSCLIY